MATRAMTSAASPEALHEGRRSRPARRLRRWSPLLAADRFVGKLFGEVGQKSKALWFVKEKTCRKSYSRPSRPSEKVMTMSKVLRFFWLEVNDARQEFCAGMRGSFRRCDMGRFVPLQFGNWLKFWPGKRMLLKTIRRVSDPSPLWAGSAPLSSPAVRSFYLLFCAKKISTKSPKKKAMFFRNHQKNVKKKNTHLREKKTDFNLQL